MKTLKQILGIILMLCIFPSSFMLIAPLIDPELSIYDSFIIGVVIDSIALTLILFTTGILWCFDLL